MSRGPLDVGTFLLASGIAELIDDQIVGSIVGSLI